MEQHAEEIAAEDRANKRLVSRRVKRRCFRGKEYELNDGARDEEDERATAVELMWSAPKQRLPASGEAYSI